MPEHLEPEPLPLEISRLEVVAPDTAAIDEPAVRARPRRQRGRGVEISRRHVLALLAIYFATRCLLVVAAFLLSKLGHHDFLHELANWDGLWYRELANNGYPHHAPAGQSTLGFFPLYPLAIWVLEPVFASLSGHGAIWAATVAGVAISITGGAVAVYYVYRLATDWWDRKVAFRAGILFILFPGSVVFSMAYSEGLLLPLAAACLFALGRKRWLLAGVLAGFATAVQPVGLVLALACAVAALVELRRHGWRPEVLRKVVVAPLLSLAGITAFALFLWLWTGSPLANYEAQHRGWGEKTDAFALGHLIGKMFRELGGVPHEPSFDLNLLVGLIGAVLLVGMLVLVYKQRHRIPPAALTWTLGVSFLALTSEFVPPNPRMLITAFPALMAVARYTEGVWWRLLLWANGVLLVLLSVLTFHGTTLRP